MDRNKRCTFFGHRDFSMLEYSNYIEEIFEYLIINKEVDEFFSGGIGNFDRICEGIIRKLIKKYPHVELKLIVPFSGYMSLKYIQKNLLLYNEIIVPNTGKNANSTEAITKRNKYMADKCRFF